jgi:HEAT repeat protein
MQMCDLRIIVVLSCLLVAVGALHDDAEVIVPKLIALILLPAKRFERVANCEHAAEALGMLGSRAKAAIPQLRQLLADEDDGVAKAAAKALEAIEGK